MGFRAPPAQRIRFQLYREIVNRACHGSYFRKKDGRR
jgi:hypothetical protein